MKKRVVVVVVEMWPAKPGMTPVQVVFLDDVRFGITGPTLIFEVNPKTTTMAALTNQIFQHSPKGFGMGDLIFRFAHDMSKELPLHETLEECLAKIKGFCGIVVCLATTRDAGQRLTNTYMRLKQKQSGYY